MRGGTGAALRVRRGRRQLADFVVTVPDRCRIVRRQISDASTPAELVQLWQTELRPLFRSVSMAVREWLR